MMRQDKLDRAHIILYLCGIIPVVWIALLIAPAFTSGLPWLIRNAGEIFNHPFRITLCKDSLRAVLVLLLAYGLAIGVYLSNERNYRRREEHGSAKWGSAQAVNRCQGFDFLKAFRKKNIDHNRLPPSTLRRIGLCA